MKCDAGHDDDFACTNDVVPVNVTHQSGHNWGVFLYCEAGIAEDIRRGFVVTRLTLDEAARAEEAERAALRSGGKGGA